MLKKVDEDENETDSGVGFGNTETRIIDGVAMTVSTSQIAENKSSPRSTETAKKSQKVYLNLLFFLWKKNENDLKTR